jgi:hypothetical protein
MSEPQYIVPPRVYRALERIADEMAVTLGRQPSLPELLDELARREAAADRVEEGGQDG